MRGGGTSPISCLGLGPSLLPGTSSLASPPGARGADTNPAGGTCSCTSASSSSDQGKRLDPTPYRFPITNVTNYPQILRLKNNTNLFSYSFGTQKAKLSLLPLNQGVGRSGLSLEALGENPCPARHPQPYFWLPEAATLLSSWPLPHMAPASLPSHLLLLPLLPPCMRTM